MPNVFNCSDVQLIVTRQQALSVPQLSALSQLFFHHSWGVGLMVKVFNSVLCLFSIFLERKPWCRFVALNQKYNVIEMKAEKELTCYLKNEVVAKTLGTKIKRTGSMAINKIWKWIFSGDLQCQCNPHKTFSNISLRRITVKIHV